MRTVALRADQANRLQDVLLSTGRLIARTGAFDLDALRRGEPIADERSRRATAERGCERSGQPGRIARPERQARARERRSVRPARERGDIDRGDRAIAKLSWLRRDAATRQLVVRVERRVANPCGPRGDCSRLDATDWTRRRVEGDEPRRRAAGCAQAERRSGAVAPRAGLARRLPRGGRGDRGGGRWRTRCARLSLARRPCPSSDRAAPSAAPTAARRRPAPRDRSVDEPCIQHRVRARHRAARASCRRR